MTCGGRTNTQSFIVGIDARANAWNQRQPAYCRKTQVRTHANFSTSPWLRMKRLLIAMETPNQTTAAALPRFFKGEVLADSASLQWPGLYVRRIRNARVVD
jgi:hypothetical protein